MSVPMGEGAEEFKQWITQDKGFVQMNRRIQKMAWRMGIHKTQAGEELRGSSLATKEIEAHPTENL